MIICLILSLLLSCLAGEDEVLSEKQYVMYAGKKEIGNLKVSRRESSREVVYESENTTSVSLIKRFTLEHKVHSVFRDGQLQRSEVWVHLNGKLREHTLTSWAEGAYRVEKDGEPPLFLEDPIRNTSLTLYFDEPRRVGEIFSEQYGAMFPLSEAGSNVYELDRSGNRTNLYFYRDNELVRAEFETLLFTARLELK